MKIVYNLIDNKNISTDCDYLELYKKSNFKENVSIKQSSEMKELSFLEDENGKIQGIRLSKIFNSNEQFGLKKELEFKEYLDDKKYSYLYIAQSPEGLDKSNSLFDSDCKRPDFLVNINNTTTVFIDVKGRTKIKFFEQECYYMQKDEIEKLYKLKNFFNVPVFIAFGTKEDSNFVFASVSELYEYLELLNKYSFNPCLMLRIPDFLLKNDLLSEPLQCKIKLKEIKQIAIESNNIIENLKNNSIEIIKSKKLFKEDLINTQKDIFKTILFENEIRNIIRMLIDRKIIKYKKYEFLELY